MTHEFPCSWIIVNRYARFNFLKILIYLELSPFSKWLYKRGAITKLFDDRRRNSMGTRQAKISNGTDGKQNNNILWDTVELFSYIFAFKKSTECCQNAFIKFAAQLMDEQLRQFVFKYGIWA